MSLRLLSTKRHHYEDVDLAGRAQLFAETAYDMGDIDLSPPARPAEVWASRSDDDVRLHYPNGCRLRVEIDYDADLDSDGWTDRSTARVTVLQFPGCQEDRSTWILAAWSATAVLAAASAVLWGCA